MGVYAANVSAYATAGLPAFPVDTRRKKPVVRHWQNATPRASAAWATKFPEADGLGVLMGSRSGLVEVDVDAVGDAALGMALERYGETPIVIRTPSGKSKIWYRHSGEQRLIRPVAGEAIDVLGAGFTIAPPSWRSDLGSGYRFIAGSLSDVANLPTIRAGALEPRTRAAETVRRGERNNALWLYAMTQARFCDDLAALEDVCATWAEAMPDPLPSAEVAAVARSAWSYEVRGANFVGLRRPQATVWDAVMDRLQDEPDAFFLLSVFRRYHSNRDAFAISPAAMSRTGNPPWHRSRIERARAVLLARGFLTEVAAPDGRRRLAGRYRLAMPDSGYNHFTPLPPSFPSSADGTDHG